MKAAETVIFAELRYADRPESHDTWAGGRNRPTTAGYDIRIECEIPLPVIGGGVMPSRLGISPRVPHRLRQKPTSKRRGKAVGRGLTNRCGPMRYSNRARRRVFVVAPEGWMQ
jgi:hypothetical protein